MVSYRRSSRRRSSRRRTRAPGRKPMNAFGMLSRLRRFGQFGNQTVPNTYYYKQAINGSYITGIGSRTISQNVGATYFGMEFRADQLPNWSAFNALYDQYMITKIVIRLIPMLNVNNVQPTAGTSLFNPGIIATIIDTDDGTAPTALAQLEQYQSYQSQPIISTKTIQRVFVPGVDSTALASGGAVVNAVNKKLQWLDCAYGNIAHFGMKIYLDAYANANAPANYQVQGFMYIKFRNVR